MGIQSQELRRLKEAATVITPAEAAAQAKAKADDKAATMAQARARKEKIISMEAERKKNEAKSELEVEQMEKAKRRQERLDYLEEGRKLRKEIDKEKNHLNGIKDRKIHDMRDAGVPEKYLTELMRHKVEF